MPSSSSYKTPNRKGRGKKSSPRVSSAGPSPKIKAVDLVTGKATTEYFFDPSLVIPKNSGSNDYTKKPPMTDAEMLTSKFLFMPCTIIKPIADDENSSNKGNNNGGNNSDKKSANNGKDKSIGTQPFAGPTLVKTSDGNLHKITDSTKLIPLKSPDDYVGMEDVLRLQSISEASLLHTLRIRYKRDDIYTAAGPILISINPYKDIKVGDNESMYSEDQMLQYRSKSDLEDKPPHLFQVADRAYSALMDSVHFGLDTEHLEHEDPVLMKEQHHEPGTICDQSIIISGESGAGKTEATKIIMKYLARITRKSNNKPSAAAIQSPDGKMVSAIEDRVLSSNPLLESFGNAQTLRNDNSSRFGKFIHINFSTETGGITGASISNYLLEKTRITHQVDGERNYHIFYQLMAGAEQSLLEYLGLTDGPTVFHYMGQRQMIKSEKDAGDLKETMLCLSRVGLGDEEQKAVFAMASAVLHLGNIQFEDREDESDMAKITDASQPSLTKACELLGIDESRLSEAILTKLLVVNGKVIKKSQNVSMAEDKRDALAKMTYSRLFSWLVNRVNETLCEASSAKNRNTNTEGFIGVLDIYGFECFDENGFEQLLINYCNEKLQRHFNRHLFEVEQELYSDEGVDWSYITFNDNRPCLELIEGTSSSVGILNALDDAWGGMGAPTEKDGKFVTQLHKLFGAISGNDSKQKLDESEKDGHPNFVTPKFGKDKQFVILHYAGEVRYTADGFVEKNMETLSNEIKELGEESSMDFSREVYACDQVDASATTQARSSIRGVSVGNQFKTNLQKLVDELDCTQPHYVRCIKPNLKKVPTSFLSGEVLKQLRYSGMMEAIRIRREGYALREDHETFFNRFSLLLNSEDVDESEEGIEQLVQVLSKRLGITDADWQIGHSKIFLRRELSDKLERLTKLRIHAAARTVCRFGRGVALQRVSSFLVHWVRFRLRMRRIYKKDRAATMLSAHTRRFLQKQRFTTIIKSVAKFQALHRQQQAKRQVRLLRDPFCEMSYRECRKILKEEEALLEKAVEKKDFHSAAKLEAKISKTKEAIERKQPLTRKMLDAQLEETQTKLDDAVSRKAYAECGPLQDKLDELNAKRKELPTIDELKQAVKDAEDAVAQAAKNRDFAGAAAGQARIDEARQRLADTLVAENDDDDEADAVDTGKGEKLFEYESRSHLDRDLADISQQINEAVASKDFSKANSLQKLYDEREQLRKEFPTLKELEEKLEQTKSAMNDAIKSKQFTKAEALDKTVQQLEANVARERELSTEVTEETADEGVTFTLSSGQRIDFASRADLEKEVQAQKTLQTKKIAAKEFKAADDLQRDIDSLESLRARLPTLSELRSQLTAKKQEMDTAVKEKRFADAEKIDSAIEVLQKKIRSEEAALPSSPVPAAVAAPKLPAVASVARKKAVDDNMSTKSTPVIKARAVSVTKSTISGVSAPVMSSKRPSKIYSKTDTSMVAQLRPAKAITTTESASVLSVTQLLASRRGGAAIVTGTNNELLGILTDTDVTRRIVAKQSDASSVDVSSVMTPHPFSVSMEDSAADALSTMIENHFRHLPVVDHNGCVVGLLDIARCLNDAITKLEKAKNKNQDPSQEAVLNIVNQQGAAGPQAAALQFLLSNIMSKAFGNSSMPTLRSILAGKPSAVVQPDTSIYEAGLKMSDSRKASLVVNKEGELVGIFGFKDMMTRAVAKEVDLSSTPVSSVMTPSPETVSPDITVLEALQVMHDHRFLNLPVCEDDGTVVGLVGVMDVMAGCGGAEGWKSVFSSAFDVSDDISDVSSVNSMNSGVKTVPKPINSKLDIATPLKPLQESNQERPVSKLRPSRPILTNTEDSVMKVCQVLASKRGAASIVVGGDGGLEGIVTDTDITRRVVAKNLDPTTVEVSSVMTPNPTCVASSDSAMDALFTMIENHFRHLPVTNESGAVVGVLDIAKCLNDAISKLEKAQSKKKASAEDAVKDLVSQQGATGAQAAALQALLGNLMSQAFGDKELPTLGKLLAGKPKTVVSTDTTLREAGVMMAENRKAVLVQDSEGSLVGIFGFKDMMSRVVAKGLDIDSTPVSSVMTPNPDYVSPNTNVLEALHTMHHSHFLNLPVCDDNGTIVGLVGVMDVMHGCGGAEGWRSMFTSAMEMTDEMSDTASVHSYDHSVHSANSKRSRLQQKRANEKTVGKLRPSKAHTCASESNVYSVAQMLQLNRGSAAIVVDNSGQLAGILTDTDVTRRVVAKNLPPADTIVETVMTPNPTCVAVSDPAMDALTTMVENHFRHLPVVDESGVVIGLLDIAKCLNDAIDKLEKSQAKSSTAADAAVQQLVQGAGSQAAAMQALLGNLMAQAFGSQVVPSLGSLLLNKPRCTVKSDTSISEAAYIMAENRKAVLVEDTEGTLIGIFGFKDLMSRVVAKDLDVNTTLVSSVMTPDPEYVSPDMTVLEALQNMHDNRFLNLPVCNDNGEILGLVGVMDVIHGCGGAEGWRKIFDSAMELDDVSDAQSASHSRITNPSKTNRSERKPAAFRPLPETPYAKLPANIPSTLEFEDIQDNTSFNGGSTIGDERGVSKLLSPDEQSGYGRHMGTFKVTDAAGKVHRVKCSTKYDDLTSMLSEKIGMPGDQIHLQYVDDEGDTVIMTSDDDVEDVWKMACQGGSNAAKLVARQKEAKAKGMSPMILVGVGVGVAGIAAAAALVLMRSKKR